MGEGLPGWLSSKEADCMLATPEMVRSLGQEDPLEKKNGNPLQYSCLENPVDRNMMGYSPWVRKESDMTEVTQQACTVMGEKKDTYQQKLMEASNRSPFFLWKTSVSFTF